MAKTRWQSRKLSQAGNNRKVFKEEKINITEDTFNKK